MNLRRKRQLVMAREMYGKPEEQTNWVDQWNSYFSIYEEMTNPSWQTGTRYAVYKALQKSNRRGMTATTGAFASQEVLEKIANS